MKKTKTAIAKIIPVQEVVATTPFALLTMAVNQNLDMDKLERLMKMNKDWQEQKAKEAFFESLAAFQVECPEIKKIRKVDYANKEGARTPRTKYNFASLGDIEKQIKVALQKHGLSKRWEIKEEGQEIVVTCLVTHKDGHTERTAMRGKLDDSGGKNDIQKAGSTISYLERYSLLAALGISTADTDDDGRSASGEGSGIDLPFISDEGYKEAAKQIREGNWTVDTVLAKRQLKPDQKSALEIMQKNLKGNEKV